MSTQLSDASEVSPRGREESFVSIADGDISSRVSCLFLKPRCRGFTSGNLESSDVYRSNELD